MRNGLAPDIPDRQDPDVPAGTPGAVNPVQSVDRALTILESLANHGELGVTEIAGDLGVHKSTAFRLVSVLEQHRLVEQAGERGKYRLGIGIIRLAGAVTVRMSLARESRALCRLLVDEFNETVNIAVLDDGYAMNITQEQGNATVTAQNWTGKRTPLHATSSGKVLLAWAVGAEPGVALKQLDSFTPHTIVSTKALQAELALVREQGWACTVQELEIGLNAVAAPIRGDDGAVVAAISLSGPSYRLTVESFAAVAVRLLVSAAAISRQLGYFAEPEAPSAP